MSASLMRDSSTSGLSTLTPSSTCPSLVDGHYDSRWVNTLNTEIKMRRRCWKLSAVILNAEHFCCHCADSLIWVQEHPHQTWTRTARWTERKRSKDAPSFLTYRRFASGQLTLVFSVQHIIWKGVSNVMLLPLSGVKKSRTCCIIAPNSSWKY